MRDVMISIKPKWCELIASGKKTIEVRKTEPKCDVPFKCYIYCTREKADPVTEFDLYRGKVIGEFICNCIESLNNLFEGEPDYHLPHNGECCLSVSELEDYGKGKRLYGWHISDLKIYDKPKELNEFFHYCGEMPNCDNCPCYYYNCYSALEGFKPLSRPPQSWCFVEVYE